MAGTKEGGIKTSAIVKKRYGNNYYASIGSKGGSTKTNLPKGFAANPELARVAGANGGRISKRRSKNRD